MGQAVVAQGWRGAGIAVFAALVACAGCGHRDVMASGGSEGERDARGVVRPYLNMPAAGGGPLPARLSETGAFVDVRTLSPAAGLLPYELNVAFWSDGATKRRWMALPEGGRVTFNAEGEWAFPAGTVFVKHFGLPSGRRLETRLLVRDAAGGVYGASYRWREDDSDAELVSEDRTETVHDVGGAGRPWYFPGPADCATCHTPAAGLVLGVKTRQLNRPASPGGANLLMEWSRRGVFDRPVPDPSRLARLAPAGDATRSVEERARSYLDANCAHCHRPGGVAGFFDARYDTPLPRQNLVDGPLLINLGIDNARVIAPNDPWRSIALARVETHDQTRMPPLAHEVVDAEGAALLRAWIGSLPGRAVLPPPAIAPGGGEFHGTVRVTLAHPDPAAVIHYTLDGSAPGKASPVYEMPLTLTEPATLRARAYKDGATRSIVVQETFVIEP